MTHPDVQGSPKVELTDHAFFQMLQEDRSFRQALVLDMHMTLESFSITPHARRQLEILIAQLDELTEILVEKWAESQELKRFLSDPRARRVFLFAPPQAELTMKLSEAAAAELRDLADKANILGESLLAWQ